MSRRTAAVLAAIGVVMALHVPACTFSAGTKAGTSAESGNAKFDAAAAQNFLSGVPKEIREQHSDEMLVAEAKKICAALDQGQSDDQIDEMLQKDLGTTSMMFTLSATIAYCPENAPG